MRHEMRWGGLAGFGAVALALIARLLLGSAPKVTDPAASIAAYAATHRTQIMVASLLLAIAIVLALWLGVTLAAVLRRADHNSVLPMLILAGFLLAATIGLVTVSLFAGFTYALATHPPLAPLAPAPYTALAVVGGIAGVAVALPLAALGLAIWGSGVFPMWLAWLSWLVAAVRVLAAFLTSSGAVAPGHTLVTGVVAVLAGVWVLAASWVLVRKAQSAPVPPAHDALEPGRATR